MTPKGRYIFIALVVTSFCFSTGTHASQAVPADAARDTVEIQRSLVTDADAPKATLVQYPWHPYRHRFYYRRYPYYRYPRFGYSYRRYRPYYYRYYGYHPLYTGYWHLYVPRYYFYPKYNRDSGYYYPDYYSALRPGGYSPQVTYIIGSRAKPDTSSEGGAQYVVRIVSRLEPGEKIEKRLALGKAMLAAGRNEAAARQFLNAMALSENSAEARLLYARACAAAGRYSAAAFALRRAVARNAEITDDEKSPDEFCTGPSEMERTLDALRRHIRANPGDTSAMFVFGFFCAKSGRRGEARAVFTRLISIEPDCKEAALMADLLGRNGAVAPKKT
jgi:tetratricopeptide (TPR) repeat protein